MSPINSNSSERDFDAIHRAQRAHEPSMEEILASIRNIIADDPAKDAPPKRRNRRRAGAAHRLFQGRSPAPQRRRLRTVAAPGGERADSRLAPAAGG